MEKFLIDSSAWIASFSKKGHESLKHFMREKIASGEVVIAGMVLLELLRGVRDESQFVSLRKKLSILPCLPTIDKTWLSVAELSLHLRSKGVQTSVPDIFISHLAITNDCVLVHCDQDYERIAKQTALKTLGFL